MDGQTVVVEVQDFENRKQEARAEHGQRDGSIEWIMGQGSCFISSYVLG